jgi:hypothetical protein
MQSVDAIQCRQVEPFVVGDRTMVGPQRFAPRRQTSQLSIPVRFQRLRQRTIGPFDGHDRELVPVEWKFIIQHERFGALAVQTQVVNDWNRCRFVRTKVESLLHDLYVRHTAGCRETIQDLDQ